MEIIKSAMHETMIEAMQAEAMQAFADCSKDMCPQCHISDG